MSRLLLDAQKRAGPHPAEIKVEHSHEGTGVGGTQLGLSSLYLLPATCFTPPTTFTFVFVSSNTPQIQLPKRILSALISCTPASSPGLVKPRDGREGLTEGLTEGLRTQEGGGRRGSGLGLQLREHLKFTSRGERKATKRVT